MWIALLREKSEALEQFKKFKFMAEVEKEVKMKCVRSDQVESRDGLLHPIIYNKTV